ncbi:VOC family protein [Bacillus pakistanensis]|uniref:VOC family protein n=1 Tax=Rossellomorea pakistanensis TaxID=992288 RepID=UPI003084488F
MPVKDITKSKEFFTKLGFTFHPRHIDSDEMAGLVMGDNNVIVMLFPEPTFKNFVRNDVTDANQTSEVLLSIDAESKEEVDSMVKRAVEAGGTIFSEPQDESWLYGAGFTDSDGHRWNVLYRDMSKMPKGEEE